MNYRINVAKANGRKIFGTEKPAFEHFFATSDHSLMDERKAREVFDSLKVAYPYPEYDVTISLWKNMGQDMTAQFTQAE